MAKLRVWGQIAPYYKRQTPAPIDSEYMDIR